MMTKVLIYGYFVGVFSSRRLEKRLVEDIGFRVLAARNEPDFRTIAEFRRIHLKALEGLFEQVLHLALKLGAMRLGRVAVGGSKVKANASKHRAMSYRRMQDEEKRLKEEAQRLLAEAEQTDKEEDKRYGRSGRGDELPAELVRREERMKRIAAAKRELEERAQSEADKREDKDNQSGSGRSAGCGAKAKPEASTQIAVEPARGLIVAQALTQEANEKNQLLPMIDAIKR